MQNQLKEMKAIYLRKGQMVAKVGFTGSQGLGRLFPSLSSRSIKSTPLNQRMKNDDCAQLSTEASQAAKEA